MHCPACATEVTDTTDGCPNCGADLRFSVRSPDGTAYGPYRLADIRQYAAEGRIARSAVFVGPGGRPFTAGELGIDVALPTAPPAGAAQSVVPLRWGAISEALALFRKQWRPWCLVSAFWLGLVMAPPVFFGATKGTLTSSASAQSGTVGREDLEGTVQACWALGLFLVSPMMLGGGFAMALKQLRGSALTFWDGFPALRAYPRLLLGLVLVAVAVLAGMMVCFLPTFIGLALTALVFPLMVDRNLPALSALGRSTSIMGRLAFGGRTWWTTIWFVPVLLAIAYGGLFCFVGVLATVPISYLSLAIAYRDQVGLDESSSPQPVGAAGTTVEG